MQINLRKLWIPGGVFFVGGCADTTAKAPWKNPNLQELHHKTLRRWAPTSYKYRVIYNSTDSMGCFTTSGKPIVIQPFKTGTRTS